jgi:uncharacterized protein YehS (DUF1456 family)
MGLNNNDIFKKLRVAHKLRDDDIVKICSLKDFKITKSELNAIFRNETHPKYMEWRSVFKKFFRWTHHSLKRSHASKRIKTHAHS